MTFKKKITFTKNLPCQFEQL